MFKFLVLTLTLSAAVADIGLGYQYSTPAVPFGVSSTNNYNSAYSTVTSAPVVLFGKGSSGYSGSVGQGSLSSANAFSQGAGASSGQYSSGSTGSFDQGSIQSAANYGQDYSTSFAQGPVVVPVSSGQISSGLQGYNYNTLNTNGLSSKFGVGSNSGSKYSSSGTGSNYNTFGTSGAVNPSYGSGYNVVSSGLNPNYNTGSNYNVQGISSSGSSANYNTFGSGSGSTFNVPSQQGLYQGTYGQNSGYQGTYQTSGDTSSLDKIGSYYQAASAANQFISSNQYQTATVQNYQGFYNPVRQPAQVYKHYYVHAAPEELEPPKPQPQIVLPPPQKHYKIIFIKAPTQQPAVPQVIPVPQQNEEKTIVYVLVKKPEDAKNIVLPKFEEKAPTKPDVFFIKYNNKQDSQSLIDNIVSDYNKGGVSATFSGAGISGSGLKTDSYSTKDSEKATSFVDVFGQNPNVGNTFESSFGGISSTTPSSLLLGSTVAPSGFSTAFENRFGSSSTVSSTPSTISGTSPSTFGSKPINSALSGSGYNFGNSFNSKPTVSKPSIPFGTSITGNNYNSKPGGVYGSGQTSSSSYLSGGSSAIGSNNNVLGSKPISSLGSSSNNYGTSSSLTSSSAGLSKYGTINSGLSSIGSSNKGSYSSGNSFNSGSNSFGNSFGTSGLTSNRFGSGLNNYASGSGSLASGSAITTSGSSNSGFNSNLSGNRVTSSTLGSQFGSSVTTPSTYTPSSLLYSSSSVTSNSVTAKPSSVVGSSGFGNSVTNSYVPKPVSLVNSGTSQSSGVAFGSSSAVLGSGSNKDFTLDSGVVSSGGLSSGSSDVTLVSSTVDAENSVSGSPLNSGSSYSYSSGSNSFDSSSGGINSGSGAFGAGSSKFSSGLGSSSSTSGSDFETTFISTSQGIPHETYGPPKFKVV